MMDDVENMKTSMLQNIEHAPYNVETLENDILDMSMSNVGDVEDVEDVLEFTDVTDF